MDISAVRKSYRFWAPIYDHSFGWITRRARRKVVAHVNTRPGSVLEIGVGTGLSLAQYRPEITVTGIDASPEMLERAREKVARHRLTNVARLDEMDARHLDFPDGSFDTVVAMFVISVVPEPERVMAEAARVCKPGGEVLIAGHFARDKGALALLERLFAPLADRIGWHSDFPMHRVMGQPDLTLAESRQLDPFGVFTFLRFVKRA